MLRKSKLFTFIIAIITAIIMLSSCSIGSLFGEDSSLSGDSNSTSSSSSSNSQTSDIQDEEQDEELKKQSLAEQMLTLYQDDDSSSITRSDLNFYNNSSSYTGYLGRGYNVITSAYFNADDVNITAPRMFNMQKLIDDGRVFSLPSSGIKSAQYMGTSLKEYQESVSTATSLSYSYGLFSKTSVDFNLSTNMTTSGMSKSVFIKSQYSIRKEKQGIDINSADVNECQKYADETFLSKLNADVSNDEAYNYYTKQIFEVYGTHALTSLLLGGRFDLNYVYNNTENYSTQQIQSKLTAAYKGIISTKGGASVEASVESEAKSLFENSNFSVTTVGGDVSANVISYEEAVKAYQDWAESINNNESLEFCDVAYKGETSPLPVWCFANAEKQALIQKIYEEYSTNKGGLFADLDSRMGKISIPKYIKKLYIGSASTRQGAIRDIEVQIANDPDQNYVSSVPHSYDLKRQTGGDFVLIGYVTTFNESEAIKDIKIYTKDYDARNTFKLPTFDKYSAIDSDLNQSLASNRPGKFETLNTYNRLKCSLYGHVYVYYSKDSSVGRPIENLGVESNGTLSFTTVTKGWSTCCGFDSTDRVNLNLAGLPIYLWVYRTPLPVSQG